MTLEHLRYALLGVSAYCNIPQLPPVRQLAALLAALQSGQGERALECYAQVFYGLREQGYAGFGDYLWDALRYDEGPYPRLVEAGGEDEMLVAAARQDVESFVALADLDCGVLLARLEDCLPQAVSLPAGLPRWKAGAPFTFAGLTEWYEKNGTGLFARYRGFLWEGDGLLPVADPDCMGDALLIGYQRQRQLVIANTQALLAGRAVSNVLLYGDSGTGKSVTVKSLLAVPGFAELRLIEVQKQALAELPKLIRGLGGRRQKFILFIDDLAFDQDDRTYSALKTILEGSLERRPANVAIYATSNRRHLVRQTFSDRNGDEVDAGETIQEKTSLADRFGLRIAYLTMNQAEFLDLVERMAALYHIPLAGETLRAQAVKFELHHPSRTPRVARQFIASLQG